MVSRGGARGDFFFCLQRGRGSLKKGRAPCWLWDTGGLGKVGAGVEPENQVIGAVVGKSKRKKGNRVQPLPRELSLT